MWWTIRVGETFVNVRNYNRVAVEVCGPRAFLVGTLKSGRAMALFAVRQDVAVEDVTDAIERALGGSRTLVNLTRELIEIDRDPHALGTLQDHNLQNERKILKPRTLADMVTRDGVIAETREQDE